VTVTSNGAHFEHAVVAQMEAVATEFDAVAPVYQSTVEESIRFSGKGLEFFTQAKVDHLVDLATRLLGDLARRPVLDIGCGNGSTDALLTPFVGELHGVDTSLEMVTEARRNNPQGHYRQYDGLELPFDDAAFDLTFAICVMHHVPPAQWEGFTQEMIRVTRPGGLVMVFEHNPLNPLTRRAVARCPFDADAVLLRRNQAADQLRRGGSDVAARRFILFAPFGGTRTRRAERFLGWFPAGAQYVVAARRRSIWSSSQEAPSR
jgi:SAM-dependent methyltransferase